METVVTCPACLEPNVPVFLNGNEQYYTIETKCPFCGRKMRVRVEIVLTTEYIENYNPHAKGFWGDE